MKGKMFGTSRLYIEDPPPPKKNVESRHPLPPASYWLPRTQNTFLLLGNNPKYNLQMSYVNVQ